MGVKRSRGNLRKSARDPKLTLGGWLGTAAQRRSRAGAKVKNWGLTPNFKNLRKGV